MRAASSAGIAPGAALRCKIGVELLERKSAAPRVSWRKSSNWRNGRHAPPHPVLDRETLKYRAQEYVRKRTKVAGKKGRKGKGEERPGSA